MLVALRSLTFLLALSPQEPSGDVPPFDANQAVTAEVLGDEIDLSLHWVHTRYDSARGTYGSLETDAWVLLAFAESPRRYRPGEGPFLSRPLAALLAAQRPDGSFAPEVPAEAVLHLFETLQEESTRVPAERLRRVLGDPPARPEPASVEAAAARAKALLLTRNRDGSFGTAANTLLATARCVEELSRCQAYLKAREPKKAPGQVQSLPRFEPGQAARVDLALANGARFLVSKRVDGGWGFAGKRDAGITAMVLGGLLAVPEPRPDGIQKVIVEGLDWLVSLQKPDGSIHEGQLANYVTSSAILALVRGGRAQDRAVIERARDFLKVLQADEGEGFSSEDRFYGGVGYGDDEKPDLSNMQMALEALAASGVPASDPAFQKALQFLQRCQNRSESNDLDLVVAGKTYVSGNDGGASYAPGESKAGFIDLPDGRKVPRSYGSMSYALLKGYLFAGLTKDDARVQAVWTWLRENYTLDVNPGFQASDDPVASYQGLFYYFYTMAKALDLYGEATVEDAHGKPHDWRAELTGRLMAMQRPDGSWLNPNSSRWFEGQPVLATAYALMTLGTARPH